MKSLRMSAFVVMLIVIFACLAAPAGAEWKPERPVTMLVGNPPGGSADMFGRTIVHIINEYNFSEQPFVMLNMPGGAFTVSFAHLRDQADTHMIGVTSSSYFTMKITGNSPVGFDDFIPLAHFVQDPSFLCVPRRSPFHTLDEMLAFAKENPGALKMAGSNPYSDDRIICEMIVALADVDIEYIPFPAAAEVVVAILGGHVDLAMLGTDEVGEHGFTGDIRPLAFSSTERSPTHTEIATLTELGLPIAQQQSRALVMSKAAVADKPEIVAYFSNIMAKVAETPEWKEYVKENGMVDLFLNAEDYPPFHAQLVEHYTQYIGLALERERR